MANSILEAWAPQSVPMLLFRIVAISGIILLPRNSIAQKVSKYYSSALQSNGTLYHVNLPAGFSNKDRGSRFVYDVTYVPGSDSAHVNFSYLDRAPVQIDSVAFITPNGMAVAAHASRIFIEQKKSRWHYRYSASLPPLINSIFSQRTPPPYVILHTKEGEIKLVPHKKGWKKQSEILSKVIMLKKLNG